MAKCSKVDLQLLVEERPDAKNVNNWHWTEKNADRWSKEKIRNIFTGVQMEDEIAQCEIVEITKCEGEAIVNNRKSKVIVFYDWVIELKWLGSLKHDNSDVEGTIEISNFSEDNSIKDVKILVHSETIGAKNQVVRDAIQTTFVEIVRNHLEKYIESLKEEFSKELILPVKDNLRKRGIECGKCIEKMELFEETCPKFIPSDFFETCEVSLKESFKCTAMEFYSAIIVKELVQAFTQGDCILEAKEGGMFELFDGNVQGYFIELIPYRLIKQKWRIKNWPEGHFSDVTFDIDEKTDCTEVNVLHSAVPKDFTRSLEEGWKTFYWNSIKRILGFGSFLV